MQFITMHKITYKIITQEIMCILLPSLISTLFITADFRMFIIFFFWRGDVKQRAFK